MSTMFRTAVIEHKFFFAAVQNGLVSIAAFVQARFTLRSPTTQAVYSVLRSRPSRPPTIQSRSLRHVVLPASFC
jgi:hypothetical protein